MLSPSWAAGKGEEWVMVSPAYLIPGVVQGWHWAELWSLQEWLSSEFSFERRFLQTPAFLMPIPVCADFIFAEIDFQTFSVCMFKWIPLGNM